MSYEGYVQVLCANGHLRVWGCYDDGPYADSPETKACSCGAPFVFHHSVDQTNDDGHPMEFELIEHAVTEQCNLGHTHVIQERRFKIPEEQKQ